MRLILYLCIAAAAPAQVVIDNEDVRVVMAKNTPGQKSRMHRHDRNRIMVHLDPGTMRLAFENGEVRDIPFKAGDIRWDPAGGRHTSENVGGTTYHIAEIEIKQWNAAPVSYGPLDLPRTDAEHATVELETPQVRVIRSRYGAKARIPRHEHLLPEVLVFLKPEHLRVTTEGKVSEFRAKAGDVMYFPEPDKPHEEENRLDEPIEDIAIEIKSSEAGSARREIEAAYIRAFESLKRARNTADMDEINRSIDTVDWVSIVGDNPPRTWEELRKFPFEALVTPFESMKFDVGQFDLQGGAAVLTGKLIMVTKTTKVAVPLKETWVRTAAGWKRKIHHKLSAPVQVE